jgi:nucleotide-binding universal stress UspA family protein
MLGSSSRQGVILVVEPSFTALVVPLDGSEFAAAAIEPAAGIARASSARLRLIGIARDDGELAWMYDHVRDAARTARTDEPPDADVIVDPDPVATLLGIAEDGTNVLAFASHDRLPLAARVMHAVGSELMARARQPFLVMGADVRSTAGSDDVVVALDGIDDPRPLLTVAVAWSERLGAPLRIVTAYEPVLADLRRPDHFSRHHGPPIDPDEYLDHMRREAETLGAQRCSVAAIADPVSVADGIVEHLVSQPAGMLVVGHRDRPEHLGAGVVRNLLQRVTVPVLLVNRTATTGEP